jgi:hypothetical protein
MRRKELARTGLSNTYSGVVMGRTTEVVRSLVFSYTLVMRMETSIQLKTVVDENR